jgi:F-type H+-transporting ATPase subunit b
VHMTPVLAAVIDLDVTYFFQLALFLGLVVVLNQLAFKPLLALFERRRVETLEREKQANEGSEEAENLMQQYQSEMGEATGEGMAHRSSLRDSALSEQADRIGKVRGEAANWMDHELDQHRGELDAARVEAEGEVESLAAHIVKALTAGKEAS